MPEHPRGALLVAAHGLEREQDELALRVREARADRQPQDERVLSRARRRRAGSRLP